MSAIRWAALAALVWTAVVLAAALLIGSPLATPSCAHLVAPPPACVTEIAAENARVWTSYTLPMLIVAMGAYAVVVLLGLARAKRRLRVAFTDAD